MAALQPPTQLPHHSRILPLLNCHTERRAQETWAQGVWKCRFIHPQPCQNATASTFTSNTTEEGRKVVSFGLSNYIICLRNRSSSKEKPNLVTHIFWQEAVRSQIFTLPWWSLVMMPHSVWRGKNQVPKRWQTTFTNSNLMHLLACCNLAVKLVLPLAFPLPLWGLKNYLLDSWTASKGKARSKER